MAFRLGIDSGGTFTDVVLFDDRKKALHIAKTPSTPANPAIGVINGITKIVSQAGIETFRDCLPRSRDDGGHQCPSGI